MRKSRLPTTLYYVEYTCTHWSCMLTLGLTEAACMTCQECNVSPAGQPNRVTRYVRKPPRVRPMKPETQEK